MRGITLFSKNSGVEVRANDAIKKNKKYGIVTLRFFKLENGGSQMRFIMSPLESYTASMMVAKAINSKEALKLKKTHKFEKEGKEVETTLTLEKWVKENKAGFAISIKRDDTSINVPMDVSTFAYLGELLRYLSTQQAWVNPTEPTDLETEEAPDDLDIFDEFNDVSEPEPLPDLAQPEPEPASSPIADGNLRTEGEIEAIRKDKKGFKLAGEWYSVNDHTKVTGVLEKGAFVTVEYRNGNGGGKFANVVTCM